MVNFKNGETPLSAENLNKLQNDLQEGIDEIETKLDKNSIYSTDEVETSEKWIDGKTLYKKTFEILNPALDAWTNVAHNIDNTEVTFIENGYMHRASDDTYIQIPDFGSGDGIRAKVIVIPQYLQYLISGYVGIDKLVITLKYTKNTD